MYFIEVKTTGHIDRPEIVHREHIEKLNNYLQTGVSIEFGRYEKLAEDRRGNTSIIRNVCSHSTTNYQYNFVLTLITTLCCEGEHPDKFLP